MTLEGPSHLAWEGGGVACFEALDGDVVTLVSSASWPPGSRPAGVLAAPPDAFRMKVHACRATGVGTFRISGRPLDLTRETRGRIASLLACGA